MASDAATPSYVVDAFDLMDEIERLRDPILVRDRLARYLQQFGFRYLMMTRLPLPRERIAPHMLIKLWPLEWLQYYDARRYYRDDPVAERCISGIDPFVWSDHADEPRSALARRIMEEARDVGMVDGYCVPVHDLHGLQAVVTMAGEAIVLPPRARRAARLVSHYAFGVLDRRTTRDEEATLSPRERDVLRYAALGRTAEDTADQLGLGTTTVVAHLRQARAKLGAANTTQAVVRAIQTRQIPL